MSEALRSHVGDSGRPGLAAAGDSVRNLLLLQLFRFPKCTRAVGHPGPARDIFLSH